MAGYVTWMTLLVVVYYVQPGLRAESWGLLGLSGVLAIVAGVLINRPARALPWLLLAAANLSFVAGQVSFLILTDVLRVTVPFPSFADVLYLSTYPLYAIGVFIFIRWRTAGSDRRSLIDALTLTAGLALLSWLYLILPYAHNPALSWLEKCFSMAYPLGDVLVLAMLARLLAPGPMQARSVQLLTFGTLGLLVSDVSYGLIQLHGSFHNGTIVDLGWAIFYTAWGAAALHPTMADLTRPVSRRPAEVSPLRLAILMLASFIAPIVLLIQSLENGNSDASVIAVFSALLYLLVLSRLWDVAASHRRALDRERVLRRAGASLASAVTVEEAAAAVKRSAADLLGPRHTAEPAGEVLLAVRDDGVLSVAGAGLGDLVQLRERAEAWLPLLSGSGPRLMTAADLGEQANTLLRDADAVLLCPLTLKDRPSGDPLIGVLAVSGQHRNLADLSATMEILASQAALAVERLTLNREVIRQGNQAYFRTLVQDTSDAILIIDDTGNVRYATPSATAIFGDVSVEGQRLLDLVGAAERELAATALARMRDHTGKKSGGDWLVTRADGKIVQVEVRYSDLRQDSTVGGLVLTLRDVTERRELENTLTHLAFHDALTGLPNRLLFQDRIAHALARVRRENTVVAVLFVDLDDFKVVNDTMGHGVGDELLGAVGRRLAGVVRTADTAARLGGDEFAILIEDLPDAAAAEVFAERVVQAFSAPFVIEGGPVVTRATVGIATTRDSADVNDLLRHADLALYAAKAAGKRGWRQYHPVLSAGLARRREMQTALEEAVAESAFTLAYQPIVSLTEGEVVGFEALVRWQHPRWGLLQPGQFIALAEETGSIVPIGSWVLDRASADLAGWLRTSKRDTPLYVSVNVSARQFRETSFVSGVHQVLARSGLPASALMLELTESVLLPHEERIRSDLAELRASAVRLAIDDFGTGYSSLSYLKGLPVDVIKIDKSFVDDIDTAEPQRALVDGIIRMARTLQLGVIAEGIENDAQRDRLVAMGCRYGQGYLFAMPMSAGEAEALIIAGNPVVPALPLATTAGSLGCMGSQALPPISVGQLFTNWQFAPVVTAFAVVAAGLYLWGVYRVWRRHPPRPWPWWRTAVFLGGILIIVFATEGGVGAYDDVLFWDHMVQHLMLLMVAPPMLVVGQPGTLLLHASRNPLHTWTKKTLRSRAVTALTFPPFGVVLYAGTIVATHLTGFMNLVLTNNTVHEAEHVLFLVVGYLYFLPLIGREPIRWRISYPSRIFLLFIAMPVDAFTGLILGSENTLPFPAMADNRPSWAPSALADVHEGGAVMWVGGAAIMFVLLMTVFVAWSKETRGDAGLGWLETARRANFAATVNPSATTQAADDTVDDDEHLAAYNAFLARLNKPAQFNGKRDA
jgi:diguanylate cyclase (GGDEF)-like protein/PAS domain S-box-containing protein